MNIFVRKMKQIQNLALSRTQFFAVTEPAFIFSRLHPERKLNVFSVLFFLSFRPKKTIRVDRLNLETDRNQKGTSAPGNPKEKLRNRKRDVS